MAPRRSSIKPRTIFTGDNLPILRGMEDASVDLIYLDPPFNSNRQYSAPIGSEAAGAAFKDTWTLEDTDDAWWGEIAEEHPGLYKVIDAIGATSGNSGKSYSIYMAIRLIEMHRILKDTGSVYLHCDPTMSHGLKLIMDAIWGRKNFVNHIIWHYKKWTNAGKQFQGNHDDIFLYRRDAKYRFNKQYGLPTERQVQLRKKGYNRGSTSGKPILRVYDRDKAQEQIRLAILEGRQVYYVNDPPEGEPISDVWDISVINGRAKERTGYPTQKPLQLLQRIVNTSSNAGDVVLDPFCGCATACLAAEAEGRQWIGIDISALAFDLIKSRMDRELGLLNVGVIHRTDIPKHKGDKAPKDIKHTLFGEQEGLCNGCRYQFPFRNFTLDHIVPQSVGGGDNKDNLQLLCGACNSVKGNRPMEYLIAQLKQDGRR